MIPVPNDSWISQGLEQRMNLCEFGLLGSICNSWGNLQSCFSCWRLNRAWAGTMLRGFPLQKALSNRQEMEIQILLLFLVVAGGIPCFYSSLVIIIDLHFRLKNGQKCCSFFSFSRFPCFTVSRAVPCVCQGLCGVGTGDSQSASTSSPCCIAL